MERGQLKTKTKLVIWSYILLWLIIWIGILYVGFAFVVWDINITNWSQALRGSMVFLVCCYVLFVPSIAKEIKK